MWLWIIFTVTFSNSLSVVEKRLIGRRVLGEFRVLPDFGRVITYAYFQDVGKCDSLRQ
jgi:hypothetical protein